LLAAITAVPERCWQPLPEYELAEVTELHYQPMGWAQPYRYVVKRDLAETKAGDLYWRYHAMVTNEENQSAPKSRGLAFAACQYGKCHQGA
jgi:hypothetical protein